MNLDTIVKSINKPKHPRDSDLMEMMFAPYYHFLYRLAEKVGTSLGYWVVFGVNQAVCCSHIMKGCPDIELIAIDERETIYGRERANKFGFKYHIHGSHAPETVQHFQEMLPKRIGVVFFDTIHIDWMVRGEYERVKPFLNDKHILIFDDVHAAEDSVMRAVNEIPGTYYSMDHLHEALGFGVKVVE